MAPIRDYSLMSTYPPGLDSAELYLAAVFFMMLGCLLALEWIWRTIWAIIERSAPLRSPATATRIVIVFLLAAALVRTGPRLWLFMRWPALSPAERADLYAMAAQSEILGVVLFSLAWLLALLGEPMIRYQLEKQPLPLHLWPTWEQMKRPLKIGVGVFAIAFALTYLR